MSSCCPPVGLNLYFGHSFMGHVVEPSCSGWIASSARLSNLSESKFREVLGVAVQTHDEPPLHYPRRPAATPVRAELGADPAAAENGCTYCPCCTNRVQSP